jgi:alkanesulfonate monooxygenase SsuD/methylene tetrahydromethanopterin reductase-like flavin-dependent oxidoreductase (luciferase family)
VYIVCWVKISFVHNTFAWDEADDGAIIEQVTEQSLMADELGFAAIILPEKHFSGYMPPSADPLMTAAYLAPQLKQAYLGFGILVPSYFHPANVVERINLLDHYTHGRLLIGIGSGFEIEAMVGYGVSFEKIMASGFEEFLGVADRLWAKTVDDPPLEIDTTYHRGTIFERVVPKPYSTPHARFVAAGVREQSIARAASRGWPVFVPFIDGFEGGIRRLEHYHGELAAAGHSPEVLADCMTWTALNINAVTVAETDELAARQMRDAWKSHIAAMDRLERRTRVRARALDGVGGAFRAFTDDFETSLRTRCLYGSPETVASTLEKWASHAVGNALMSFNVGSYDPARRKLQEHSIELFAREVLPRIARIETPSVPPAIAVERLEMPGADASR